MNQAEIQSDYFNFDPKSTKNYDPKSVNWFTRFLWWCAGADQYFLLRSPKQDRVKYAGIGGIVLATGLLAMASGGFAFDTAFGPKGMAGSDSGSSIGFTLLNIGFAIFWGLMIFNLDRFIVSSTGKGDGTDSITRKELWGAFPRIVIAFILGVTISKPLEIKILETEINVELRIKQQEKLAEFNESTKKRFQYDIDLIDADLLKIETDRNILVDRQKVAEKEYTDQMQGRAGNAGYGPRAKQLEMLSKEKIALVESFDVKTKTQVDNLRKQRQKKLEELDYELNVTNLEQAHNLDGLLARIATSHDLSLWMGIALLAIFLSIEMGPILFKLMMTKGAYDYMVENFTLRQNIENGIIREEHLYEGKGGALLMEKYRYLQVEAIQKEKEEALEAQKELTTKIIGSWKNAQLKELNETPKSFYESVKFK
jgi:hypothetical protein